jgi:cytochrome c-type biogenesis protein CcmE
LTRKQKRLATIAGLGAVLVVAAGLILYALSGQISFFYSPSQAKEAAVAPGTAFRLGGMVKDGTWKKTGEISDFVVTDGQTELAVHYVGLLPDLFREGQGVVADGTLGPDGVFAANRILAKHDENYMPKEIVEELKARGEWQREPGGATGG